MGLLSAGERVDAGLAEQVLLLCGLVGEEGGVVSESLGGVIL